MASAGLRIAGSDLVRFGRVQDGRGARAGGRTKQQEPN